MTTSVQSQSLSPFAQFQQLFSSAETFLSSLCESTNSAFRRVHVMKKDENGNIRLYDVKQETPQSTGPKKKTALITYVEEIKTGEMSMDEADYIVATKCALIALGMPFYTFGKMAWHAFKTPIEIVATVINTLVKAGNYFAYGKLYEGVKELGAGLILVPEKFGEGLFEVVKSPVFGALGILAGLYGVFKPFHGRKIEAMIENAWQNGASYKEDFRNIPSRAGENCGEAFIKDVMERRPFYLAHCFQPRGNIHDPRVVVIRQSPL